MRPILLFALFFCALTEMSAQTIMGRQIADQFPRNSAGTLTHGLTWLPQSYQNTTRRYPLIIFLHGTGETGTTVADLSKLYTASPRSVAGRIADGWNAVAVNPLTGVQDSFIVVSPQASSWSYGYAQLKYILPNILSRYRVDTGRIYLTGLSAGGSGVTSVLGSKDSNFIKRFAAFAPISGAGTQSANGYTDIQTISNLRFASGWGARIWRITGDADSWVNSDIQYSDSLNRLSPSPANKFTAISGVGHSAWGRGYDPLFRPTANYYGNSGTCNNGCPFGGVPVAPNNNGSSVRGSGVTQDSLNLYEWLLLSQRTFAPVTTPSANAGFDKSIVFPVSSTTLNGTGTPGAGYTISSYAWTKINGPSFFTIVSPFNSTTDITGLLPGTYTFRLTVTNNIGATVSDDIQVFVTSPQYASPVISTISSNQSITLPISNANVSLNYTLSGATLKSVEWKKLKTPGQLKKKIGIIGSSTSQGGGASTFDSSYTGRLKNFLLSHSLIDSFINLAWSGYNIFRAMPSSYVATGNQTPVDTNVNVTAILKRKVDVVIVNFPTNAYDVLTIGEIMMAYRTIYDSCTAKGVECFITTTQPRNDFGPTHRQFLQEIRDSILNRFGKHAINFYDPITTPGTNTIKPEYSAGDNIHINDAGHRQLFNKVVAADILQKFTTSPSSVISPLNSTTVIAGLSQGTHTFLGTVTDSHEQSVNATAVITVNPLTGSNQNPSANAGSDQTITLPVNTITLTGSGTDPDGTITAYQWTKIAGPAQFTIVSPTTAQTAVNNLVQGVYSFELSVTDNLGAVGRDTITVTLITQQPGNCGGRSYTPLPAADSGYYNYANLQPGDTLFIDGSKAWSYIYLEGKNGTAGCPIVIMNKNGQASLRGISAQLKLRNCTNIKVTGSGVTGVEYGFYIQPYPDSVLINGAYAISIEGRSKKIELSNIYISHAGIGMNIKEDGGCDPNYNYPNWVIDSITIHHNRIVKTWNQGMYIGNTSPDNAANSYSPRPVVCNGITTYPRPVRMGNIKVYENIVDSTGRAGIQISSASTGLSEIYNNTITHSGLGGDEAQGAGINLGAYSNVWVYNNYIRNTLTYGISSFGASSTNNVLKIENNIIDSSGYMRHYYLWEPGLSQINLSNRTVYTNTIPWVYSIGLYTKPTENPIDSTRFRVSGNSLGYRKNQGGGIVLSDNQNTFHKSGNYVCNNIATAGGSMNVVIEQASIPVYYSTDCGMPANLNPLANAGVDKSIILPTNTVSFTGSGTDPDGTIAAYQWTKLSGPTQFIISTPTSAQTTVNNLIQGTYQFVLTVTDNNGAPGKDTVAVTVNAAPPANLPPIANAGADQTISLPASSVTLSGSGTDPNGTISAYLWTKVAGPAQFTIVTSTQTQTTVNNLIQGTYRFELRVTDNQGANGWDTVTIIVNNAPPPPGNQIPTANAGTNQTTTLPVNTVTLSGSGLDADGTIASYLWTKLSGPTQFTIGSPTAAQTVVNNLVQGIYSFELKVTDNLGATARDTISVTVNIPPPPPQINQPPIANAGTDKTITLPVNTVTLAGSGTDPDGTIASYLWTKLSGPTQFTIGSPTAAQTVVNNLVQGIYSFELKVTDNLGATARDTISVIVNIPPPQINQPPIANAGTDKTITLPVNTVTLAGSGTDPDGTIASYLWTKLSGPTQFTISTPTSTQTTVNNLLQGAYQFVLTVTDNNGATGKDTITVTINSEQQKFTENKIYPNPATSVVNIEINNSTIGKLLIRIYDSGGLLVHQSIKDNMLSGRVVVQVNISNLKSGIYFVKFGTKAKLLKLIKQ